MNICDFGILLTPTKGQREGFSNSLLELAALGKPLIATNSGGNPELIDENNGFLINGNNLFEIELAINKLLSDYKLRK